ncbi:MAG: chemotaxis protein CheA [Firmicutes bacterium]|nr:chemotaxis protein CheA [Bacillota bacterium]
MPLEFDASPEDIRVFLDEAEELIQIMEEEILRLERDPQDAEALRELFRAAHTLKGSSATLGHRPMAEVTHGMENLLDRIRKGQLAVSTGIVDALFACLDVLKAFKDEIATGEPAGVDTGQVLAALAAAGGPGEATPAGGGAGSGAGSGAPAAPAGDHPALRDLDPAGIERLRAGIREGRSPLWIQLAADPTAPMPGVRYFQALLALGELGEVVRSWPTQEEIEQDRVGETLSVVFLADRPLEEVRAALAEVPEVSLGALEPLAPALGAGGEAPAPAGTREAAGAPAAAGEVPAHDGFAPAGGQVSALPGAGPEGRGGVQSGARAPGEAVREAAGGRSRLKGSRTVRVDVEVLDRLMDLVGELVIDRTRLVQVLTRLEAEREGDDQLRELQAAAAHIGRVTAELQEEIMRARMLPVENLFKKFPRMVRDLAQQFGKEINFVIRGEETELDRSVIEEIGDPLMHLLRNAVDHGIEHPEERVRAGKPRQGTVLLEAAHQENHIIITVRDDGRGIDPDKIRAAAVKKGILSQEQVARLSDDEAIRLIFSPGFSTAEKVSEISGRGVGLDVVHKNIEKLNGAVEVRSQPGQGTEFRIKLPLTLAIIRALLVEHRGCVYAVPLNSVTETLRFSRSEVQTVRGRDVVVNRGAVVPLIRLEEVFGLEPGDGTAGAAGEMPARKTGTASPGGAGAQDRIFVVIVNLFGRQAGIVVDGLLGEGDVVIKSLGQYIGEVPGIAGATLMGDGSVALILDVAGLMELAAGQHRARERIA